MGRPLYNLPHLPIHILDCWTYHKPRALIMNAQDDDKLIANLLVLSDQAEIEVEALLKDDARNSVDEIIPLQDAHIDVRRLIKSFAVKDGKIEIKAVSFEAFLSEVSNLMNTRDHQTKGRNMGYYRSGKNFAIGLRFMTAKKEVRNKVIGVINSAETADDIQDSDIDGFSLNALKNLHGILAILKKFDCIDVKKKANVK